MMEFHYRDMLYRTNADATCVERYNAVSQTWTQTHGLTIRSQALTHIAKGHHEKNRRAATPPLRPGRKRS